MSGALRISIGQHSHRGGKEINQDFHGALIPEGRLLAAKGVVAVVCDGISTSAHGREAAETACKSFLSDYYATPEGWSVRQAGDRVLSATNAWLYGRTRSGDGRYDPDRGFVCTFTAIVLKGRTAHVLHVGDARLYRVSAGSAAVLTRDHRQHLGEGETVLDRALGISPTLRIDYCAVPVAAGDVFLLATDGMAEHLGATGAADLAGRVDGDLDRLAGEAIDRAIASGANDNLTLQILRIDALPEFSGSDVPSLSGTLPLLADPRPGQVIDGLELIEQIHGTDRSRVFKARDLETGETVAVKVPADSATRDPGFLQALLMEEWVARRIDAPQVMKAWKGPGEREKSALYTVFEWVEGLSLTRWMQAHPQPDLAVVFALLRDMAAGVQAMHRRQMVHQDLRPENIVVTGEGRAVIIDFGSTRILGSEDGEPPLDPAHAAGLATHQYMAPEGFFGVPANPSFDVYALGVIAYQMLTGRLPYGGDMARAATPAAQSRVAYRPAAGPESRVPVWVDAALRKAVHVDPSRRHLEPAELLADLTRPNPLLPGVLHQAVFARDPVRFWQGVSLCLAVCVVWLIYLLSIA